MSTMSTMRSLLLTARAVGASAPSVPVHRTFYIRRSRHSKVLKSAPGIDVSQRRGTSTIEKLLCLRCRGCISRGRTSRMSSSAGGYSAKETLAGEMQTVVSDGPNLRIWEYHIADGDGGKSLIKAGDDDKRGDDESSTSAGTKRKVDGGKATLYVPSDEGGGWTSVGTESGARSILTDSTGATTSAEPASVASALPTLEDVGLQLERHVLRHFLPAGYPDTVAAGYRNYVAYCFFASVCGSAAMVLSTQTLLVAVGVGSTSAAPMAAALNWVMKDGIGQLGGIAFASHLGSAARGSSIDTDPKRWRVASALSMDGATLLEILCPLFPGYFLPIASVANVGKNIGFLAASASRAAIHQSLALKANLGDVTAKAGSQSIAASLIGTGLGIVLSPLMHGEFSNVAAGFAVLSLFHQACTYKSLRYVYLQSLNRHRLNIVLEHFVRECLSSDSIATTDERGSHDNSGASSEHLCVLPPSDVAQLERFIPFLSKDESRSWLQVGCKLEELFPEGVYQFHRVRKDCIGDTENYLLHCKNIVQTRGRGTNSRSVDAVPKIYVTYLDNANGQDIIRGMLHAHIIHAFSRDELVLPFDHLDSDRITDFDVVKASNELAVKHFDELIRGLDQIGWNTQSDFVKVEAGSGYRLKIE